MMKILLLLILVVTIQSVHALNIQRFGFSQNPKYATTKDGMLNNDRYSEKYKYIFTSSFHYIDDPLVYTNKSEDTVQGVLINSFSTVNFGAGVFASKDIMLGVNSFASQVHQTGNKVSAMGDTSLYLKYKLTSNRLLYSVAAIPQVILPTGNDKYFTSDNGVGYGIDFAFERDFGLFQANLNLGIHKNDSAKYKNIDYKTILLSSLSVYLPINKYFGINAEGTRLSTIPFNSSQNPSEVYLGIRNQTTKNLALFAGCGFGSTSSDYRAMVGLKLIPTYKPPKKRIQIIKKIVKVNKYRKYGKLLKTESIIFKHNQFQLTSSAKIYLRKIAKALIKIKKRTVKIVIEGHANKLGRDSYNINLSLQRAVEIKNELIRNGVSPRKFLIEGHGEASPKSKILKTNRRVEFRVYGVRKLKKQK